MDAIGRGLVVYVFLLIIFRLAGKRTLAQITTFDFVILLIIGEVTEGALVDNDHSVTNSFLLITTLVGFDVALSLLTVYVPALERYTSGTPVVLVEHGELKDSRLRLARVTEEDILAAARELQGLERMEQVKYAILETDGKITIVPAEAK